ncbi:Recombination endonuclease VII [Gemmata sp. SH-PL17]|uniref:endonuclease domain-containing protein n=1 Tax=Gemmata sp. SH-PL17 TaxID=1630693 RepID=UPI00078C15A8|nr:Recombination endonuclease VII [Gemmata sp. SH-PL17]
MGSSSGVNKGAATKIGVTFEEWERRRTNGEAWCYCCRQWQAFHLFGVDSSRSNGLTSACKQCVSYKATASRYGITVEEARQLRTGAYECEICGRRKELEVDHDHTTGAVRGLLCGQCNKGLGLFKDSLDLLSKATAYLNRGKKE